MLTVSFQKGDCWPNARSQRSLVAAHLQYRKIGDYEWPVKEAAASPPAFASLLRSPEAQTKANQDAAERLTIDAGTEANQAVAHFEVARTELERRRAATGSDERGLLRTGRSNQLPRRRRREFVHRKVTDALGRRPQIAN